MFIITNVGRSGLPLALPHPQSTVFELDDGHPSHIQRNNIPLCSYCVEVTIGAWPCLVLLEKFRRRLHGNWILRGSTAKRLVYILRRWRLCAFVVHHSRAGMFCSERKEQYWTIPLPVAEILFNARSSPAQITRKHIFSEVYNCSLKIQTLELAI
jgi:hypothetical protein